MVRVRTLLSTYDLGKELREGARLDGPVQKIGKYPVQGVQRVDVRTRGKSKSELVLHIQLEDYLKVVLPGEMPESWPIEALKAQAVASRSYVESQKLARTHEDWDVEGSVMDQVFDLRNSRAAQDVSPLLRKAVQETSGQILVDKSNVTQKAYFHADCGGATERAFFAWKVNDQTQSVRDGSCPIAPSSKWVLKLSQSEVERKLGASVQDLRIAAFSPSQRASSIYVKTSQKDSFLISGEKLRQSFGFDSLKSTLFKIRKTSEGYVFEGRGHGHGVGLCQWGARQLALQGKTYRQILEHYYPQWTLKSPQALIATVDEARRAR